jgi:hypothetical protein
MIWRHDFDLNHIACCLKSAFVSQTTVEVYCNVEGLQAPGGGSIPTVFLAQAYSPVLVNLDRTVPGWNRIFLVELTKDLSLGD